PITPTNSPSRTDIERPGITTMSLNRFPTACSSRITGPSSSKLQELELSLHRDFRRDLVVGDEEFGLAVRANMPLAADDAHLRDVLDAAAAKIEAPNDRIRLERTQGLSHLL